MKRFAIGICLLIMALFISVYSQGIFLKDSQEIESLTQSLLDSAENLDIKSTEKKLEQLLDTFKSIEKRFNIILYHDDIENLEMNISSLKNYIEIKDMDSFKLSCISILKEIENLRDSMHLKLENIL